MDYHNNFLYYCLLEKCFFFLLLTLLTLLFRIMQRVRLRQNRREECIYEITGNYLSPSKVKNTFFTTS